MQQQAAMQNYYQQQAINVRMQHQQQQLQLQQRQAMQRLQPPQLEPHVPESNAAAVRKRKLSLSKEKKVTTKKTKKP